MAEGRQLSPTSWALLFTCDDLGFRFASPQALCHRHASRAETKLSTCLSAGPGRVLLHFSQHSVIDQSCRSHKCRE